MLPAIRWKIVELELIGTRLTQTTDKNLLSPVKLAHDARGVLALRLTHSEG